MRILQLHNRYREPGGEDQAVRLEAGLLRAAGHHVETLEVANPVGPARTATTLMQAPWNAGSARLVAKVVDDVQPDVAHLHNWWFALSPAVVTALRRRGVPVVATLHNYRLACVNGNLFRDGVPCTDCLGTHPWRGVAHRCYRGSVLSSGAMAATLTLHRLRRTWHEQVDLFIAVSQFQRDLLLESGTLTDPERVKVKANVVEDPGPRPAPPSSSRQVLMVGRLVAEKGTETALRAWASAGFKDLELLVIGDGMQRTHLETMASRNVRFVGQLPAQGVQSMMLEARALLVPSRSFETFGLVVAEALAAGLPVVASDSGPFRELLDGKVTPAGWLVPPGDVAAWSHSLSSLRDYDGLDRRSVTGRERYEASFSPATALEALEDAYATAMDVAVNRSH